MRAVMAILGVVLVLLQWPLWFGEGSWSDVRELREQQEAQERENAELHQRNRALEAEVRDLRTGTDAVEERARRDLGMIREDEIFFFVVGDESKPVPGPERLPETVDEIETGPAESGEPDEPAIDDPPLAPEEAFDG
ncbi:MAG: cell division protein FtsB [Pseudomonadota bacterium]